MNELMIMCTMIIGSENAPVFNGYTYMPTEKISVHDAFKEFQNKCNAAHIKLSDISEVILRDKNHNDIDAIRQSELTKLNNTM